jgi:hypothetical protein
MFRNLLNRTKSSDVKEDEQYDRSAYHKSRVSDTRL